MTNQQTKEQLRPQHREDSKLQKLVKRIEQQIALQAKTEEKERFVHITP
jgi:hypothetical protein